MVLGPIGLLLVLLLILWLTGYAGPTNIGPIGAIIIVLLILWAAGAIR